MCVCKHTNKGFRVQQWRSILQWLTHQHQKIDEASPPPTVNITLTESLFLAITVSFCSAGRNMMWQIGCMKIYSLNKFSFELWQRVLYAELYNVLHLHFARHSSKTSLHGSCKKHDWVLEWIANFAAVSLKNTELIHPSIPTSSIFFTEELLPFSSWPCVHHRAR